MGSREARRISFVCTGNTCRSVMAEYLARSRYLGSARFESVGIRLVPSEKSDNARETLRSLFGIDASKHVPRDLGHVDLSDFDVVVAIDDPGRNRIYGALVERGVPPQVLVRWKIEDPFGDDPGAYEQ